MKRARLDQRPNGSIVTRTKSRLCVLLRKKICNAALRPQPIADLFASRLPLWRMASEALFCPPPTPLQNFTLPSPVLFLALPPSCAAPLTAPLLLVTALAVLCWSSAASLSLLPHQQTWWNGQVEAGLLGCPLLFCLLGCPCLLHILLLLWQARRSRRPDGLCCLPSLALAHRRCGRGPPPRHRLPQRRIFLHSPQRFV